MIINTWRLKASVGKKSMYAVQVELFSAGVGGWGQGGTPLEY